MNITFINRMLGIKIGGGENFDLNIARALQKRVHNIRFVVGRRWQTLDIPLRDFDVAYIKTPYLRDTHYKIAPTNVLKKVVSVGALEIDRFMFCKKVFEYLKNDTWTDIYQICGHPQLGVKLTRLGKKAVVRWPGIPSNRMISYMRECSAIIANGDAFCKIKQDMFFDIKEINIGVDTEIFYPKKTKKKNFVFLFVGRIVPVKNLTFLIETINVLKEFNHDFKVKIIGDGDSKETNKIKRLIIKYDLENIIWLIGNKTGKELVAEYQNADCFVLTSSYDNYPNVILEAMACGLPVIATRTGGIPMQVEENKTGFLVELNNISDMKDKMHKMIKNHELREKMGCNARKKIEKEFSWAKSAKELEKLYEYLI